MIYPLDVAGRQKIRDENVARAQREAAQQGSSLKCNGGMNVHGVAKHSDDLYDGCQNDGTTCLCSCHDALSQDGRDKT